MKMLTKMLISYSGGNIVKAHVGRWSEDCPEHQGVVVYSMNGKSTSQNKPFLSRLDLRASQAIPKFCESMLLSPEMF